MKRWSARLFTVLGIPVEVHVTFLLLLGLFLWQGYVVNGVVGAASAMLGLALIFGSVLLHELGHCVLARHYRVRIPRILLLPIGGVAMMHQIPKSPKAEFLITAAGPMVNFLIAGFLYFWVGAPRYGWLDGLFTLNMLELARMLAMWNLAMGLFNMIPVFPMDGGRIFRALLATRLTYLNATRIATYTAKVLIVVGIGFALFQEHNFLLAALFAFIWVGGEAEYRQVRQDEAYRGLVIGDITMPWLGEEHDPAWAGRPALCASWPLEVYGRLFEKESSKLYPVYDEGKFVGIIDTKTLDAAVSAAHRRQRRQQGTDLEA